MSKYRSIAIALTTLGLVACGGDEEEATETEPETTAETASSELAPEPAPEPAAQPAPSGAISLSSGFMPDPHTVTGTAGGPVDASTLSEGCTGNVSQEPNHVLAAEGTFSTLRIMVHSDTDTTLVVQRPDGSYACNDDSEALDPLVELSDAAGGNYRIWVGTWGGEAAGSYTLGVSEMSSVTPSTLGD